MQKLNKEKLSIEEFGKILLDTNDLDPIYVILHKLEADIQLKKRWMVGYWCFYHAGFASYLSQFEGQTFWDEMLVAAKNEELSPLGGRWPRGKERRHFRGLQGIQAVRELSIRWAKPEYMVDYIANMETKECIIRNMCTPQPYHIVAKRAKEHRGFGDWISFKICDMLDRILGIKIDFDQAAVFMFDDPKKAALMVFENRNPSPSGLSDKEKIDSVVTYLTYYFKLFDAPPLGDRPVGLQEVETILCKWKSHMNNHYPVGNDLGEIKHGLQEWSSVSEVAKKLVGLMP